MAQGRIMEDREPYITGGKMRDKFLTEAMGFCYHTIEAADTFPRYGCSKCGLDVDDCIENDFSMWDAFGKLWAFLIAQGLQEDFIEATWQDLNAGEFQPDWVDNQLGIRPDLIDPVKCADAVYKYLKNRGEQDERN